MALNIEVGTNIKYTDESGTYHLTEGDEVICYTGEKKYAGRIAFIGNYEDKADGELYPSIYIDTSRNKTNYSGILIKIKDITFLCKNPFSDDEKPFRNEEEFVNIFVDKGFSQEKAKAVFNRMNDAVIFYNTPISNAMIHAIQSVADIDNAGNMTDRERKDMIMASARECSAMAINEYLDLVDMFMREVGKEGKHGLRFSDVFSVVSKCWDDLAEQNRDKIMEISGKMRSNS